MKIIDDPPQIFNPTDSKSPTAILTMLDLIDQMTIYCHEQAADYVQAARWYQEQAEALAVERAAVASGVKAALAEAERLTG